MILSTLLNRTAELEQLAADLYSWYAEIFSDNPAAVGIFVEMKKQELEHRNLVQFQQRLEEKNKGLFQEIDVDLSELNAVLSAVKQHMREGVFELGDAIDFALWLENSMAETHGKSAIAHANPRLARLMRSLSKSDDEHRKRLREFASAAIDKSN